ncbi:hypothetical protein C8F01DRAFT_538956 [Mycena amicta]|nr:hypothetical protein C8F01DRAFT_538956 [Mycena amicta]
MSLDALPPELLLKLPYFVHCIEDLLALSSTSRALYRTCANPSPKLISKLAADSGRIFFRPHPHILIAATARQVADWAVQHDEHRFRLEEAIRGGVDKLLELAIDVAGLTMEDIRRLWRFKDVLNPLDRKLDLSAGPGTGRAWTVCNDPATTLVSWVIYGELFHHSTQLGYLSVPEHQPLSSLTRCKWFVYCMPDVNSFVNLGFESQPDFFKEFNQDEDDKFQQLSMQTALHDLLNPPLWEAALRESSAVYKTIDSAMRGTFLSCVMHLGFRSLELLVPGGPERLNGDLETLAANLEDALQVSAGPQTEQELVEARNEVLREFVADPWWSTGFPTISSDIRFTLWPRWEEDEDELVEAIRNPAEL